jgi:hypothetical protein
MSFLRLLRLTKMLKLLRMIRVLRSFKELRLIMNSIFGCTKSILWSSVLILAVTYTFSVIFLQGASAYMEGSPDDEATIREIRRHWVSISLAMHTLFAGAMGGEDWDVHSEFLYEMGLLYYAAYLLYVFLFVFVISNTISSIFLEALLNYADSDHGEIVQLNMEKKKEYMDKLQIIFDEVDANGDGELTYEEFCEVIDTPHMCAFASSLDLDMADAQRFFKTLSEDGRKTVDVESFVVGCIKLGGAAKSMDLLELAHSQKHSAEQILKALQRNDYFMHSMKTSFTTLHASVAQNDANGHVDLKQIEL